ncbi:MAG: hypothetical protein H8E46_11160 [FCB group bacterium]|nr:hypothetical protein [FCB group bacterium]
MKKNRVLSIIIMMILFGGIGLLSVNAVLCSEKAFRVVFMPGHFYYLIENKMIYSHAQLENYLIELRQSRYYIGYEHFEDSLNKVNLNFDKEALVIIKHRESSESTKVEFIEPVAHEDRLICIINRIVPQIMNLMEAHYCYALVVDKTIIREIEVKVEGKEDYLLRINP